uniref:Uncharacterized protein n=1 Tax=Anopheles maculatus TaxID=74869 RepID=A0A182SGT0_9DIPT
MACQPRYKSRGNRLDHNRLAGATQTSKSSAAATVTSSNNSPKPLAKSLLRSSAVSSTVATTASNHHSTPPHLLNHHQHAVSNGNNGVATSPTTTTSVKAIQRNGTIILDKTSSPLLICDATSPVVVGEPVKPVTAPEMVNLRNGTAGTPEEIGLRTTQSKMTIPSTCTSSPSSSILTAGKEPNCDQQLRQHQPTRENGTGLHRDATLNIESVGKGPELVDISLLNHAQKGVEALGVLVQYLVFNVSMRNVDL